MALWKKLKSVFTKSTSGQPPQKLPGYGYQIPLFGPDSTTAWTQADALALYNTNGYLRAIIDILGNGVAQARWRVYKRVSSGKAVQDFGLQGAGFSLREKAISKLKAGFELIEVPNHRVLQILENPSPDFTGQQTTKLIQAHLDLSGEAFLLLTRDANGAVTGFVPVPPHCVASTPAAGDPYFGISYESLRGKVPAADVLHFKHPNPVAPMRRGTGLVMAVGDELAAAESIGTAVRAAMGRSGLPVAMVAVSPPEGGVSGEAQTDLKTQFDAQHGRPEHAGKVMIVDGKITAASFNANFRELQTSELAKDLLQYVRQCFGVSVEMLGDMTGADRSKADAARYLFADQSLAGRLEFLRSCLQKWLVPLVDPSAVLHYDDIRPSDYQRIHDAMALCPQAFTFNEVRTELAGLEPLPELGNQRPLPLPGTTAPVQSLDENGQPLPEEDGE